MSNYIITAVIGYLLGNIQSAFFLGKWIQKVDIREHGTSNIGASNATVVLGKKLGFITLLADILKAVAAVLITRYYFPEYADLPFWAGSWAVIGHIFPFFLKFKGGKGVASLLGMLIVVNWQIGLIAAAVLIIITLLTNYIAIGAIVLYLSLPVLLLLYEYSLVPILLALFLLLVGFFKHYSNFIRIKNGTELKVLQTLSGKRK